MLTTIGSERRSFYFPDKFSSTIEVYGSSDFYKAPEVEILNDNFQ